MNLDKITLFEFDPKSINWKFKATQSKRRMKLYIKMKKAETAQWDALKDAESPNHEPSRSRRYRTRARADP